MARASGSYPAGRWFKSDRRYHLRPVGQAVKTPPFHGGNMGSIPVRVTNQEQLPNGSCSLTFFHSLSKTVGAARKEVPAKYGDIAQLVRAFASHARGHGFEPHCLYQWKRHSFMEDGCFCLFIAGSIFYVPSESGRGHTGGTRFPPEDRIVGLTDDTVVPQNGLRSLRPIVSTMKKALAKASAFFNERNPCGVPVGHESNTMAVRHCRSR